MEHKALTPPLPLYDQRFQYVPSISTDVTKTWARFGWTPSTKNKEVRSVN